MYQFCIAMEDQNSCTNGISNWEVCDGFFGAPLNKLTSDQVEDARNMLICKLARVVLYTVHMPVSSYADYVMFFRKAHLLGIENVKLSYDAISEASQMEIKKVLAIAEVFSIKVLFELEAETMEQFGLEQYAALRSTNTGLIFDPNSFVKHHINPYLGMLYKMKLKDDIVILRVRDMLYDSLTPVLPEKGNSEIKECASNLLSRSYQGYFSFDNYGGDFSVCNVIEAFKATLCAM